MSCRVRIYVEGILITFKQDKFMRVKSVSVRYDTCVIDFS